MIFSDHVPVEQEVALKTFAAERDLLVMGPDCGTAVVDGIGLGFANVVAPGPVGLVAASGTGCQQVLALLDHAGVGVAAAYGVGGRDLSAAVGGLSTRTALARLDADPAVELALLISKPPAEEVAASLTAYADGLGTPVLAALLGAGRPDLTAATEEVLRRLGHEVPEWPVAGHAEPAGGTRLHGLFVGGTLKEEAAVLCAEAGADATLVDFGDDDFTEGRAHPMIDPSLRLERLAEVAADATTGVILLDVVLGHGAEDDPAASLAPALDGRASAGRGGRGRHRPRPAGPRPPGRRARRRRGRGPPVQRRRHAPRPRPARRCPMTVVGVGLDLLAEAIESQAAEVTRVDWRPPLPGTEDDLATVALDPARAGANVRALERMLAVQARLVDVVPAHEALGLEPGQFLHAGPPIAWDRASGPLRGALMGGAALEGLVDDPEDAAALFADGTSVSLEPCHHRRAVGPMAGVVTPSMWMFVLEDPDTGARTHCTLNEGLGKVLRYGAYSPDVLTRLRWMGDVLGPLLQAAVRTSEPVDVTAILGQMLQMGDEAHNRNRAGTLMLLRDLAPALVVQRRGLRRRRRGASLRRRQRPLLPQPRDARLQARPRRRS